MALTTIATRLAILVAGFLLLLLTFLLFLGLFILELNISLDVISMNNR
jgi:hypothetical protein